jgi:hypothetical protein
VYKAGDRVLAKVSCVLTGQQYQKIQRAVTKHLGADVNLLIVNCLQFRVDWTHFGSGITDTIASPKDAQHQGIDLGVVNLDGSVVEFGKQDRLTVSVVRLTSDLQREYIYKWVKRWAGEDVEVVVQEGPLNG